MAKVLHDENGKEFIYAAYLDGKILDETANQERTDFTLSSEEGSLFEGPFTWSALRASATEQIAKHLRPFTAVVHGQKQEHLNRFFATQGPMYRPVLRYVEKEVALLDPEIDDTELDLKLYRALHTFQERLRAEGTQLIASTNFADFEDYAQRFDDYFSKISDVNRSDLPGMFSTANSFSSFFRSSSECRTPASLP